MKKSKNKIIRYRSIFKKVSNSKAYFLRKLIGFNDTFVFQIKNFGTVKVPKKMLSPFRENFFDEIYFRYIPESVFNSTKSPVIFDIGANVGYFSLTAFSKFPKAKIFSFEPHPYCFKVLSDYKTKFEHLNWNIYRYAISDANGELTINTNSLTDFTTVASIFENNAKKVAFTVQSKSMSSLLEEESIKHIDFIKIDCEGAEYDILYTSPKKVYDAITSLCIETHKGSKENQNINHLNAFIKKMGYTTLMHEDDDTFGYIWAWKE